MKYNREFEIAWQGLKPGVHVYEYVVDDHFMAERNTDESEFSNWKAKVTLHFDKQASFFMLRFDVSGSITVPCDRCGQDFDLQLWDEFNLLVKLTGEDAEPIDDEDDVVFIPRNETVIDISNWLYEFVMLSIPLQHIHPDKPDGTPGCDPQILKLLNQLAGKEEDHQSNSVWKGLDALKEKDSNKHKTK